MGKVNGQFIRVNQAIWDDWSLSVEASRNKSDVLRNEFGFTGAIDPGTYAGLASSSGGRSYNYDRTQKTIDVVLKGSFHMFGGKHNVIMGGNMNKEDSHTMADFRTNGVQIPNIFEFNPREFQSNDPYFPILANKIKTTQKGIYGSLAAEITKSLTLIFGGRLSWYKNETDITRYDLNTGGIVFTSLTKYEDNKVFTPYLGLVFDITKQWSAYGSIAETYKSQATSHKGPPPGTPLNPVTGRTYEIGVKGNMFNNRLNTTLALFSIKRDGQAVRDQAYPPTSGNLGSECCYLDDGRIISKGIDIGVSGEIVNGWQILAGYTFNHNENKADSGRYNTVTPKHLFKLWSSYELKGILDGLKLGGGITAQSDTYVSGTARTFNGVTGLYDGPSVDYKFNESGRVLVDLFAQYHFNKHWSAAFNINNIFDKKYYQTVGTTQEGNWYGEPRNFLASMRYSY